MRILITGGTGFVGSALASRLIEAGHEVFCACRPGSFAGVGQSVPWDVRSSTGTASLPEAIDTVIHLAQSRNYRDFPGDAREMFDVNVATTMSLLLWAARAKVERLCLVSSGAVYEPFEGILREDAALSPGSFLGASKLASENIAKPFSGTFELSVLRLFFPFGPTQTHRLIPDLIRRVRTGEAVHVTADGEGMRLVPTYIDDVTAVIMASIASSWTGIFNVATPEVLSIRQIAEAIGRHLGVAPRLEAVQRKPADVVPNLDRLAQRFDLGRFTRFEDGLLRTIKADLAGSGRAQ